MKHILIGIWHGRVDIWHGGVKHVQCHKTDIKPTAEAAAYELTLHAEREDVPDRILVISDDNGPFRDYEWECDMDFTQKDFLDRRWKDFHDRLVGH